MRAATGCSLLTTAILLATGCDQLGVADPFSRARPRLTEIETTVRYDGGTSSTVRTEIDYRQDGRVDELTRTANGDFLTRTEISYDRNNRPEELTVVSDDDTVIVELSYTGALLTEMRIIDDDDDTDMRVDISYFRGDARFVENIAFTVDSESAFSEASSTYSYDESSRIKEILTTYFSENTVSDISSESRATTELRYDNDTGRIDRVTVTTETEVAPPPVVDTTDYCEQYGYYGDGYCDNTCPKPDWQDCGGSPPPEEQPEPVEPEIVRDTYLYSASYTDEGKLDEMDGPDGERVSLDYDEKNRVSEVETRNDAYTSYTEYSYDEGLVTGHSFSPDVPQGQFFDLHGASWGTLPLENPLALLGTAGAD